MADRVRFILDRMALLFRQMEDTKIFSQEEVKSIVKRTTDFEYLLCRRELTVNDVLGYLKYELNLDKLRLIRSDRLLAEPANQSKDKQEAIRRVQTGLIGHINYIFERAVRRFSTNIELWYDFIAFLQSKNAANLLSTAFGKVLALHPKCEDMWISAAIHELEKNGNAHSARVLLQRSIRANPHSKALWLKYFEFEVWNGARIGDRKRILELQTDNAVLLGAPMVVLTHAIKAVPDVHFACELHRVAQGVSPALTLKAEEVLLRVYGGSSDGNNSAVLWTYLIGVHLRTTKSAQCNSGEHLGGKRKFERLAMATPSATFAGCLRSSLALISEGHEMLRRATQDNSNKKLVVNVLGLLFDRLAQDVSEIASQISIRSGQGISNSGRKLSKSNKSSNNSAGSSSAIDADGNMMSLFFDGAETALCELDTTVGAMLDHLTQQLNEPATTTTTDFVILEIEMAAIAARHHAWLIMHSLGRNNSNGLSPSDIVTASDLVTVLATQTQRMVALVQAQRRLSGCLDTSSAWVVPVEHWAALVRLGLSTALRMEQSKGDDLDGNDDYTITVAKVVVAVGPELGASVAMCCETGISLVLSIVDAVLRSDSFSKPNALSKPVARSQQQTVVDLLLAAIRSDLVPSSLEGARVRLGQLLLRLVTATVSDSHKRLLLDGTKSQNQVVSGLGKRWHDAIRAVSDTDIDSDASSGAPISGAVAVVTALAVVDRTLNTKLVHTNREPLYAQAVSCLETLSSDIFSSGIAKKSTRVKQQHAQLVRAVLEEATTVCPHSQVFWDRLEQLERSEGNLKQASHIQWRRSRLLQK